MGRELLPEHADAIRRYVAARPRGKFGAHAYTAEDWGVDSSAIRTRTKPYVDHYGVAIED